MNLFSAAQVILSLIVVLHSNPSLGAIASFPLPRDSSDSSDGILAVDPDLDESSELLREFLETHPIQYPAELLAGVAPGSKPSGIHAEVLRLRTESFLVPRFNISGRYFASAGAGEIQVDPQVHASVIWARAPLVDMTASPTYQIEGGTPRLRHVPYEIAHADNEAEAKALSLLLRDLDANPLEPGEIIVVRASDPMCHQCQLMAWHLRSDYPALVSHPTYITWNGIHGEDAGRRVGTVSGTTAILPACRGGVETFIRLDSVSDHHELLSRMRRQVRTCMPSPETATPSLHSSRLPHAKYFILRKLQELLDAHELIKRAQDVLRLANGKVLRANVSDAVRQKFDESKALNIAIRTRELDALRDSLGQPWLTSQLGVLGLDDSCLQDLSPSIEDYLHVQGELGCAGISDCLRELLAGWIDKVRAEDALARAAASRADVSSGHIPLPAFSECCCTPTGSAPNPLDVTGISSAPPSVQRGSAAARTPDALRVPSQPPSSSRPTLGRPCLTACCRDACSNVGSCCVHCGTNPVPVLATD